MIPTLPHLRVGHLVLKHYGSEWAFHELDWFVFWVFDTGWGRLNRVFVVGVGKLLLLLIWIIPIYNVELVVVVMGWLLVQVIEVDSNLGVLAAHLTATSPVMAVRPSWWLVMFRNPPTRLYLVIDELTRSLRRIQQVRLTRTILVNQYRRILVPIDNTWWLLVICQITHLLIQITSYRMPLWVLDIRTVVVFLPRRVRTVRIR